MFASLTSHELQLANGFGSGLSNLPPSSLSRFITTEAIMHWHLQPWWYLVSGAFISEKLDLKTANSPLHGLLLLLAAN